MTSSTYGPITACQLCASPKLALILNLGHQPPVHGHLTEARLKEPEVTYPLRLTMCEECSLLQLDYAVDPRILFPPDYPYNTGVTNMLVKNFRSLAKQIVTDYKLTAEDLVVDIGSNDGTLLQGFKNHGTKVLGVEPTDAADLANSRGLVTEKIFFNAEAGARLAAKHGQAKVITSTNVFAHIYDVYDVIAGISALLKDDGIFVSESQYVVDILEKLEVDTIYHEHLRYYSLDALAKLFSHAGFTLVDAERISAAGGSIRAYAMKGAGRPMSERARAIIESERAAGIDEIETWRQFAERAAQAKRNLLALLLDCKRRGRIVGVGAPGRSNTLLNFCHIDTSILDYAGERSGSPKIGLLSPGMHIPIVDETRIISEQPEFALLLSWHIGDELMAKLRERGYRGQFVVPLPNPTKASQALDATFQR